MHAITTGLFYVGHVQSVANDSATDTLIIGIECPQFTHYVRSNLPVEHGSVLHRLAIGIGGFTVFASDVRPDGLLGRPFSVELIAGETWADVRRVEPWPAAPRYSGEMVITSSDPKLTGRSDGGSCVVGGTIRRQGAPLPEAPAARETPRIWRISDLRNAELPVHLPFCVRELAQKSLEWETLVGEAATPSPRRR